MSRDLFRMGVAAAFGGFADNTIVYKVFPTILSSMKKLSTTLDVISIFSTYFSLFGLISLLNSLFLIPLLGWWFYVGYLIGSLILFYVGAISWVDFLISVTLPLIGFVIKYYLTSRGNYW